MSGPGDTPDVRLVKLEGRDVLAKLAAYLEVEDRHLESCLLAMCERRRKTRRRKPRRR